MAQAERAVDEIPSVERISVQPGLTVLTQSAELALLTLAVYTLIQQIEGNVIVPLVMSQAVRLHRALLAIGVVAIGQLFGIMGVLLAVPILTALVVLVEELWVTTRRRPEIRSPAARQPPAAAKRPPRERPETARLIAASDDAAHSRTDLVGAVRQRYANLAGC